MGRFFMVAALAIALAETPMNHGAEQEKAAAQVFRVRVLYAPGHFGNSYEVAGEREMREILVEAKHWGFTHYGDWFDTVDCSDPFASRLCNLGRALWERKKANFRTAQSLGFRTVLVLTPNHVYLDQCVPELRAKAGGRIFGQLLCPSKPEARRIILRNYRNLFADLAKAGVRLDALSACPYDYGGCKCEACAPWILTFAKLCREIHAIAEKYHPGIEMHFIGWWWSAQEHRLFTDWADKEAPGWARSIALHIPYGCVDVSDVPLPKGCERWAFVHIGYAERATPRDVYGHLGPVVAADRLERTVAALARHGCTGVMAYSEGIYDDVNKALLAGLGSGRYQSADDVLEAYAARYFGADPATARRWAAWLRAWGKPFQRNPDEAAKALEALLATGPKRSWRLAQWEAKTRLMALNAKVGKGPKWTPERLAAADAFWAEKERLDRQVYGLGPLRHVLNRRYCPLPWYREWARLRAEQAARMGKNQ